MQSDRRGLHIPGICTEFIPSERARLELQPSRKLWAVAAFSSAGGPTMHPAVTQVTKHQSAGVQSKTLHLLFANIFINLKSIHIFSLYDHKVFYVEIFL